MGKPTVHDIAKEAGVSLATVDRVLNARAGVREKTVKRVQAAIESLGYIRDLSAANLARQRQYRFAFVLPEGRGQFVETLCDALTEAAQAQQADRTLVKIIRTATQDPHALAETLNGLGADAFEGVAVMAPETPQLRDAIARLKADGLAIVALVSDLPNSDRDHFVGINNIAAGRTAAVLMGRFIGGNAGTVLIAANSMLAHDSIERRLGFDAAMSERFANISVLPSLESHGDPDRMRDIVTAALRAHPDVAGIYSLGTGNAAVLDAIKRAGYQQPVVIAHELTPLTRRALEEGTLDAVITQNVGHLVRSAIRVLRAKCDDVGIIASQERIRIDIVIRENLP